MEKTEMKDMALDLLIYEACQELVEEDPEFIADLKAENLTEKEVRTKFENWVPSEERLRHYLDIAIRADYDPDRVRDFYSSLAFEAVMRLVALLPPGLDFLNDDHTDV